MVKFRVRRLFAAKDRTYRRRDIHLKSKPLTGEVFWYRPFVWRPSFHTKVASTKANPRYRATDIKQQPLAGLKRQNYSP